MSWDLVGLTLRMIVALAVVLALMWVAARMLRSVGNGKTGGVMELMARQPLGRTSSVAVIRVADRALIVGITEGKVSLLTETDLDIVEAAQAEEAERRATARIPIGQARPGGGSIFSPATWRQAAEAIRDRTARRG